MSGTELIPFAYIQSGMSFNPGLNRVTLANLADLPADMAGTMAHEWLATWNIAPKMQTELGGLVAAAGLAPLPDPASPKTGFSAQVAASVLRPLVRLVSQKEGLGWLKNRFRRKMIQAQGQKVEALKAYPLALNEALKRGDTEAAAFAERMGIALAAVVATLNLAPPESRVARPEWPDEHWKRWQGVQQIVLGGGVLEGVLGQHIYAAACQWLARWGVTQVQLHLFSQPRSLMLHGAARQFQEGPVLVLDAGHSALKRAVAEVSGGQVTKLELAPLLPTPYALSDGPALLKFLTEALAQTVPAGQRITQMAISLSAHLDQDGQIERASADSSFYGLLVGLPLVDALQESLQARLGYACSVKVLHEGQAVVNGLPGMDAALLLGTSVGGAFKA